MAEETLHKKKPFFTRVKYSFIVSIIFFVLTGFLFPIFLEAPLTLMSFVGSGTISVILMWISIIIGKFLLEI